MNKKSVLIAIVVVMTTLSATAQQFYFGLGGSFTSPWMTNQNNYGLPFEMDYVPKFGGNGQIIIGYDFNKNVGAKIEAGYGILGQKYEDTYKDTVYTRNINLNYFQLPVLFKFRTSGEKARFFFNVGPQFNFLMSAKQEYFKRGAIYTDSTFNKIGKPIKIGEEDVKDRYTSMDIMARLDIGAEFTFTPSLFLTVGMTSAYGLMDVNAEEYRIPDYSSGDYNPSHNLYGGVNVSINYVIPLGNKEKK